jgi:hypothetical protein
MMDDRSLQRALAAARAYAGAIDGDVGPKTKAAITALVVARRGKTPISGWTAARLRVAAEQAILQDLGFYPAGSLVDGLVGPNTRDAWERWQNSLRATTPPAIAVPADAEEPEVRANVWPKQAGVAAYYGTMNTSQTKLALPYPMRLAWDKTVTVKSMTLHAKVAASAGRVLGRALEHYGEAGIRELGLDLFGGSLAVRKMRGGSAYSMHSWGIAIDFDPERNQLRWGRDQARLAKADAVAFWTFWEAEGWVSLGRARNYDWMHVQAARL